MRTTRFVNGVSQVRTAHFVNGVAKIKTFANGVAKIKTFANGGFFSLGVQDICWHPVGEKLIFLEMHRVCINDVLGGSIYAHYMYSAVLNDQHNYTL